MSQTDAAVLLIGNELLSGRTRDANLSFIGERLAERGIRLLEARVIPDDASRIVSVLDELRSRYRYVFTTGGIGPTHDDITADCVAEAFGVPIDEHPEARRVLLEYFRERQIEPNAARMRMARIPEGGVLIDNPVSAAPGFRIENVYVFAGVPRIMQAMFDSIVDELELGEAIGSVTVLSDLTEGAVADALRDLQARFSEVEIGSYPGDRLTNDPGGTRVALVARGVDVESLALVEQALADMVNSLGGEVLESDVVAEVRPPPR